VPQILRSAAIGVAGTAAGLALGALVSIYIDQIQQVVDQRQQVGRRAADEVDLAALLLGQAVSLAIFSMCSRTRPSPPQAPRGARHVGAGAVPCISNRRNEYRSGLFEIEPAHWCVEFRNIAPIHLTVLRPRNNSLEDFRDCKGIMTSRPYLTPRSAMT